MFSNSDGSRSLPFVSTVYCRTWSEAIGAPPIWPSEAWMFCPSMAAATSPGVMERAVILSTSSQMRIE